MEILETIGFDLGHGETAVAKAIVESIEPPQMLEINNKKHQITALGWHPQLGYLVGEQALIQAGVTQLQISIRTLADLETSMKNRAEEWLKSDRAQQIINNR
jgi:molecular chaperone DnaK (HSP70)|nr:hypothetical protein [Fischerella sp.]